MAAHFDHKQYIAALPKRPGIYRMYGADGELMAEYGTAGSGGTQYLAADGLGSTRLVMDGSGGVLERLDYFPFGQEIPAGESYGNRNGARVIGYGAVTGLTVQFTGKVVATVVAGKVVYRGD